MLKGWELDELDRLRECLAVAPKLNIDIEDGMVWKVDESSGVFPARSVYKW